jgi:hypothetical protein
MIINSWEGYWRKGPFAYLRHYSSIWMDAVWEAQNHNINSSDYTRGFQTVAPPWGCCWSSGGGELFIWATYVFWTKYGRTIIYIYILPGTLLGWHTLLISQYRYWLRTESSTFCRRLKSAVFRCRHTPTTEYEVALLSQLVFVSYYYADERNYCTLGVCLCTGSIFQENKTLIHNIN